MLAAVAGHRVEIGHLPMWRPHAVSPYRPGSAMEHQAGAGRSMGSTISASTPTHAPRRVGARRLAPATAHIAVRNCFYRSSEPVRCHGGGARRARRCPDGHRHGVSGRGGRARIVPGPAIQIDGGSEFTAGFEIACQAKGTALYELPPRSLKLNGRRERLNGTARREVRACYDGDLDLPTLQRALRAHETH